MCVYVREIYGKEKLIIKKKREGGKPMTVSVMLEYFLKLDRGICNVR